MSVKTGAVGSNPRIDKLMNVNAESLRAFAATSIVSGVLMTPVGSNDNPASSTAEADSVNHDEAYEKAEDSRKTVRENRDKITIMPELPQEGIYVKDFHKGNIVQRYKKAAEERQMQLQAAATLAFAEKDALIRNGIEEENRNEFFAGYLSLESEYLVEGALLTCSQATNDIKYIDVPDSETGEKYVFEGNEGKTENELLNVKNPANDGEKRYARVSDTVKKENIGIFRNCKLTTSSSASKAKVLEKREECRTYGTCFALMDLCDEWVNVQSGAEYGTADGEKKNCINMLSHLGCYQGGMIFPLDTGQGESEEEIVETDFYELAQRYGAKTYDNSEELAETDLEELVARIIYGEQTQTDKQGQEAVAWTMINRLLSQNVGWYGIDGELTLRNAITKKSQYTAFAKESENEQAYIEHSPDDKGWLNAVRLGHYLAKTFGNTSTVGLQEDELKKIKSELEENIGVSPVGNGVAYRATKYFEENHTTIGTKHYFKGKEIKPGYQNHNGNTYFDYVE